jgi:hypothetical protein
MRPRPGALINFAQASRLALKAAFTKTLLLVTGNEAKAWGIDQLCTGLKAGIEGGIHAMQNLWDLHRHEEEWGFLLIDAKNAFNEQNRMSMLAEMAVCAESHEGDWSRVPECGTHPFQNLPPNSFWRQLR